ncbi:RNA polymerase sigma factor [Streptomyces sp. NPDC005181]|uniref:RNA polymerase sigma factor n=1 Tax=Streptomyces sp. NPDC005181 TaxID=3156869 RepID=UPI0033ADB410
MRPRIRAGDRQAFADLYEEYARTVYNHALRLTSDWSTAEEVMSETFLAAWRTREQLAPDGGSLKPWLLGIATHKSHNANRSLRRRLTFLASRPAPPPVADFAEETAGRIDDTRRLAAVHGTLSRLRRQEQEVLALCVWSGLDYAQTAEALGVAVAVAVGTVRSRLSRARARLSRLSEENRIAEASMKTGTTAVKDGQFVYVRSLVRANEGTFGGPWSSGPRTSGKSGCRRTRPPSPISA